jgi:hypothetical protein
MTKIERQIAMLEATLRNDADVLSVGQQESIKVTIAGLRGMQDAAVASNAARTLHALPVPANVEEGEPEYAPIADGTKPIKLVEVVPVYTPCSNQTIIDIEPEPDGDDREPEPGDDDLAEDYPGQRISAPGDSPAPKPRGTVTRDFLTSGQAAFTFASPKGESFTFRLEEPQRFRGEYFAQVMTGTSSRYLGMMNSVLALRFTKGSRFSPASKEAKVLALALDIIAGRKALPAGYTLTAATSAVAQAA